MQQNYATQDYGLANWLVFNRVVLLGCVKYPGESRLSFVFQSHPDLDFLIEDWGQPHDAGGTDSAKTAKRFFKAHTIIKSALKEPLNVEDLA